MKKATIDNNMYDVYSFDEFSQYRTIIDTECAIEENGYIYPIRTTTDVKPGFYTEGEKTVGFFVPPQSDEDKQKYSSDNVIDFSSKDMKVLIEQSDILQQHEREILTSIDNIYTYTYDPKDDPEMALLKEALALKQCDIDKYDYKFGLKDYPNNKRLLNGHSMTNKKYKKFGNNYDLKITMTIEDASPDVPNPMGKVISRVITNDREDD